MYHKPVFRWQARGCVFPSGHLENISDNMLMGAVNAFNGETNKVWNRLKYL